MNSNRAYNFRKYRICFCASGVDPDDTLDEGYTDAQGNFQLDGSTRELTPIEPVLKIYHDCDDGIKVILELQNKIEIPQHHLNQPTKMLSDKNIKNMLFLCAKKSNYYLTSILPQSKDSSPLYSFVLINLSALPAEDQIHCP